MDQHHESVGRSACSVLPISYFDYVVWWYWQRFRSRECLEHRHQNGNKGRKKMSSMPALSVILLDILYQTPATIYTLIRFHVNLRLRDMNIQDWHKDMNHNHLCNIFRLLKNGFVVEDKRPKQIHSSGQLVEAQKASKTTWTHNNVHIWGCVSKLSHSAEMGQHPTWSIYKLNFQKSLKDF